MPRKFLLKIITLLLIPFCSYAEEQKQDLIVSTSEQIATYSMDSELLIGNVLSPISGNLNISQKDLISKGSQNIELIRYYNPPFIPRFFHYNPYINAYKFYWHIRNNYKGWEIFPHYRLKTYWSGNSLVIRLPFSNGMTVDFYSSTSINSQARLVSSAYGINNLAGEYPSGQSDIRNTRIVLNDNNSSINVYLSDGTERYYFFIGHQSLNEGIYLLKKEIFPNGKIIKYSYQGNQLISIKSTDIKEKNTYAKLNIQSENFKPKNINDIHGNNITYEYSISNFEIKLKNTKDSLIEEAYNLIKQKKISGQFPSILNHVSSPFYKFEQINYNSKFLLNEFYGKDLTFKCDYLTFGSQNPHYKVNKLYLPIGEKDSFSSVYTISYDPPKAGEKEGRTVVKNINGTSKIYTISKNLLITSIEDIDENSKFIKEKRYNWLDNGWIMAGLIL